MSVPPFNRSSSSYSSSSSNNENDEVKTNASSKQFQLPGKKDDSATKGKQDDTKKGGKGGNGGNVINIPTTPIKKETNDLVQKKESQKSDKTHDSKKKSENAESLITGLKEKEEKEKKDKEKEDQMFGVSVGDLITKMETTDAASISSSEGIEKKDLSKVVELVQKMVAQMATGTASGQTMTTLQLKGVDVPVAFLNSSIELTQTENGMLTIRFTNFATPQQEAQAIALIEKDKSALTQLATSLQAKNITVSEMQIGTHMVNIPRTDVPLVFQAPPSVESQQSQQQRERDQQQGEKQGRDQDEQKEEER